MRRKYITNFRLQKVFQPAVLERMEKSKHSWWGQTDKDRDEIIEALHWLDPAAAEKAKQDIADAEKQFKFGGVL